MQPNQYRDLKKAYIQVFNSPNGKIVLQDLSEQAYFEDSTFNGDVNRMLINEGARLLFLRIRDMALSPMPPQEDNSGQLKEPK